jgi:internalin A
MGIEELYRELDRAYSDENLNLITGKLILLYKNRNFDKIREIAGKVFNAPEATKEKESKLFSRLMMMYHPDKGTHIRERIRQLYKSHDIDSLNKFSHVLLVSDIDTVTVNYPEEDIDYNPEYGWDSSPFDEYYYNEAEFYSDPDDPFGQFFDVYYTERDIYYALKIRGFGMQGNAYPWAYLNYLEELDLARNGLQSLEGIEYCCHTRYLDISNNELSDINSLSYLSTVEELYLENNFIRSIESLQSLFSLRILDLSGNYISDISPLFELENLEFVNLAGNPVPAFQVENLRLKGVLVMVK